MPDQTRPRPKRAASINLGKWLNYWLSCLKKENIAMVEIPKNVVVWNQLASVYPRDEELVNQGCGSVEAHWGQQRVWWRGDAGAMIQPRYCSLDAYFSSNEGRHRFKWWRHTSWFKFSISNDRKTSKDKQVDHANLHRSFTARLTTPNPCEG